MIVYGVTVTITRQTEGRFGEWTAGEAFDVDQCIYWQTPGVENTSGQDTLIWDVTLRLPPGTDVRSTDRITIAGTDYAVVSQPIVWESAFTGFRPGVEVHLQAVTG